MMYQLRMADLRASVVYLLRLRIPWRPEHLATLAAVPLSRARAYVTQLATEPICAVVMTPEGQVKPGVYARRWIALEPRTRPGGNSSEYRRQREVRAELEQQAWRAGREGQLLTSQQPPGLDSADHEDANMPSDAQLDAMGMTLAQAASLAQCHPHTIRRRIHDGTIKAIRVGPRLIRIPHGELAKLRMPVEVRRG